MLIPRLAALAAPLTLLAALAPGALAATRYVDADGLAGPLGCGGAEAAPTAIQPAVDAAEPDDTVEVCPGTYAGPVYLTTPRVTLRGASLEVGYGFSPGGAVESIIAAGAAPYGVAVLADGVTVEGVRVEGAATPDAFSGICVSPVCAFPEHAFDAGGNGVAEGVTIRHDVVHGFGVDVDVLARTSSLSVWGNRLLGAGPSSHVGVWIREASTEAAIVGNEIEGHDGSGAIVVEGGPHDRPFVAFNRIRDDGPVALAGSSRSSIEYNLLEGSDITVRRGAGALVGRNALSGGAIAVTDIDAFASVLDNTLVQDVHTRPHAGSSAAISVHLAGAHAIVGQNRVRLLGRASRRSTAAIRGIEVSGASDVQVYDNVLDATRVSSWGGATSTGLWLAWIGPYASGDVRGNALGGWRAPTAFDHVSATLGIGDEAELRPLEPPRAQAWRARAVEGQPLRFSVVLEEPQPVKVRVPWSLEAGTATLRRDVRGKRRGTLVFQPGQLSAAVTVPTVADGVAEGDETVALGVAPGQAPTPGTIVDA